MACPTSQTDAEIGCPALHPTSQSQAASWGLVLTGKGCLTLWESAQQVPSTPWHSSPLYQEHRGLQVQQTGRQRAGHRGRQKLLSGQRQAHLLSIATFWGPSKAGCVLNATEARDPGLDGVTDGKSRR